MIRLSDATAAFPRLRVISAPAWNGSTASFTTWVKEPMWDGVKAGYEVLDCERVVLPQIGTARLRYRMGVIDGDLVGVRSAGSNPAAWNPATMTCLPPSLIGKEIRIEQRSETSDSWTTIFWGQVEYEEDSGWVASTMPSGDRVYHLTDALARTRKWIFRNHGFNGALCEGVAPYNTTVGDVVRGNKGTGFLLVNDVSVRSHTLPGAGTPWTDLEIITNALALCRPAQEPLWIFSITDDSKEYLDQSSQTTRRIGYGSSVLDLLLDVADWKRGRGIIFLDWATVGTSTDAAPASISTYLRCMSPFYSTFTYSATALGGSTLTWTGAAGRTGTPSTVDVDLIGDQRAVADSFQLGDASTYRVEYLETVGDPIEFVATFSVLDGTLAARWTAADETAMVALSAADRIAERWRPVGQRFGIDLSWSGAVGNGNGGGATFNVPKLGDDGAITNAVPVSPLSVKMLPDLPVLEGYVYTGASPARADGSSTTTETSRPNRRRALALIRTASDTYLRGEDTGLTLHVDGNEVWLTSPEYEKNGQRIIASNSGLGPSYAPSAVVVTVAIDCPTPLRMATAANGKSRDTARTKKTISAPGLTLWQADAGAIYDLTTAGAGQRSACRTGTGKGILRDDRLTLCAIHQLAARWYGLPVDTFAGEARRSASWSLRCGGLTGSFAVVNADGTDNGTVSYPPIGYVVHYLYANGSRYELNTPITRIRYDHVTGTTTWTTDWQELDFSK